MAEGAVKLAADSVVGGTVKLLADGLEVAMSPDAMEVRVPFFLPRLMTGVNGFRPEGRATQACLAAVVEVVTAAQ